MQRQHWKHAFMQSLASLLAASGVVLPGALAQDARESASELLTVPAGLQNNAALDATPVQHLPFAHFAIPFDIDRGGRAPSEVHLWVSPDQGKSWMRAATSTPDKRSFEFHAAAEGEYIFAVQTRDERGVSALAAAPPMRICVDTTKPLLQVAADVNSSGRLVIEYRVEEKYLQEASVHLTLAVDGRGQWQEVALGPMSRQGDLHSGQVEIDMPRCRELELRLVANDLAQNTAESVARYNAPRTAAAGTGMQLASKRAAIKAPTLGDQPSARVAGQPGLSGAAPDTTRQETRSAETLTRTDGGVAWDPQQLRRPEVRPSLSPTHQTRPLGQTVSGSVGDREIATHPTQGPGPSVPMANRFEELPAPPAEDAPQGHPVRRVDSSLPTSELSLSSDREVRDQTLAGQAGNASSLRESRHVETLSDAPIKKGVRDADSPALRSVLERVESSPSTSASQLPAGRSQLPFDQSTTSRLEIQSTPMERGGDSSREGTSREGSSREGSSREGSSRAVAEYSDPASADETRDTPGRTGTPGTADAYHSRSRAFSLDYSVESLRGMAVADIELWGTDDRGTTWLRWGSDPDRESPFDVQVGNDGLFGFRMVIIGQNGMVSNRPQNGDAADMWINVDTKMPTVKITRALYGEGAEAGMLVIDYTCEDENLHDRPITLGYSQRPGGPWNTIATGIRNSGIYLWKADPNLPQQVYLRVQAVDRAGNVQEHRLDLPINLRGLTPRGRIQGFRPIESTSP